MKATTTCAERVETWREVKIVGLVGAGYFMNAFFLLVLPPLFPLIKADLGLSYTALGGLITAYALATSGAQIPLGVLVDRVGARWVLMGGMLVLSTSFILVGVSSSYAGLLALMLLGGIANGVFQPADYAILSSVIDRKRLGRAFSAHSSLGYLGLVFAPGIMTVAAEWWDWRGAAVLSGLLGLVVLAAMVTGRTLLISEVRSHRRSRRGERATRSRALAAFITPAILWFVVLHVLLHAAGTGIRSFSVSAAIELHGMPLDLANGALSLFYGGSVVGVIAGGIAADRVRRPAYLVAALLASGAAVYASAGALQVAPILMFLGFGVAGALHGGVRPARDMLVREAAGQGNLGTVFASVSAAGQIGGAAAPIVLGWLMDRGEPALVFHAFAVIGVLAAGVVLAARRAMRTEALRPDDDRRRSSSGTSGAAR